MKLDFEGKRIDAREGDTVAEALLRGGVTTFSRGPKYHRPRGPFCFGGTCAQCHVRVDGEPNVPACETRACDGMRVDRQNAIGLGDTDFLRAVDFLFPDKLDHHRLMTGVPGMTKATQAIARRLAGVGTRPTADLSTVPASRRDVPFVVVGGGRSGLAAARATNGPGLLIDARPALGGRALDGFGALPDGTLEPRIDVMLDTRVVGLFEEGGDRWVLARGPSGLVRIRTGEVHLATGGIDLPLPFGGNDLPGVVAGRPLARLVEERGLFPKSRVVVVAAHEDALVVARRVRACGLTLEAVVDVRGNLADDALPIVRAQVVDAVGRTRVRHLVVQGEDGVDLKLPCDLVAVVAPLAPAYELAAEVGAEARFDDLVGGFALVVDDRSRTTVPWVKAFGSIASTTR